MYRRPVVSLPDFFWGKGGVFRQAKARAWWCALSNYLGMMCIVLLHCTISAEIRIVDSQSDFVSYD